MRLKVHCLLLVEVFYVSLEGVFPVYDVHGIADHSTHEYLGGDYHTGMIMKVHKAE